MLSRTLIAALTVLMASHAVNANASGLYGLEKHFYHAMDKEIISFETKVTKTDPSLSSPLPTDAKKKPAQKVRPVFSNTVQLAALKAQMSTSGKTKAAKTD